MHCARLEEAEVHRPELLSVFVRSDHFVEFIPNAWFVAVAGADASKIRERLLGFVGISNSMNFEIQNPL
jgi:hypothetical protein